MIIYKSINKLNKEVNFKANVGFVPTMGSLHKGHISLINSCKKVCEKTLVSIFINPSQFNKKTDLKTYPRNLKKDLNILNKLSVDYILIPSIKDVYKNNKDKKIRLSNNQKIMCSLHRPGHFEGVLAVINQFLKRIKPKYLFLGEKDYQQLFLIKKLVKKNFKVKVLACKTVRDKNNVALSSRNNFLKKKNLKISSQISTILINFRNKLRKNILLKNKIKSLKNKINNLENIEVEYLEIRNKNNLSKKFNKQNFKVFLAYYNNKIRLIDNY